MHATGGDQPGVRILIVDDHAIVRHGLVQLASQLDDVSVCHEAESAEAALAMLQSEPVDLVILDAALASAGSFDLVGRIKARFPKLPVLLLAPHDDGLFLERALRAGASGYVLKQEPTETLVHAIRKVLKGGLFLSERMQDIVLQRYLASTRGRGNAVVDSLSPRELEVFQLIGQGHGTSQIAAKLSRSVKTIEAHRATIKQKLGLKSGIELTQFAAGWVRQRD